MKTLRAALAAGLVVDARSFEPMFTKEQIQPYLSRLHKQGLVEIITPARFGCQGAGARYKGKL